MDFFPKSIYYPKESVIENYESGNLASVYVNLLSFIERHIDEVVVLANEIILETDDALIEALQQIILKRGTINPASEMADQIREIQNETWYRGEEGEIDSVESKNKWIEKYAQQWREARTFECFIIIEKDREKVLEHIKGLINN